VIFPDFDPPPAFNRGKNAANLCWLGHQLFGVASCHMGVDLALIDVERLFENVYRFAVFVAGKTTRLENMVGGMAMGAAFSC
jgi:hypothetical protein